MTDPDDTEGDLCETLCEAMWLAIRSVTPAGVEREIFLACLGETVLRGIVLTAGDRASQADLVRITEVVTSGIMFAAREGMRP